MRMNLYQGTITEKYYKNSVILTQARGAKIKKKEVWEIVNNHECLLVSLG